MEEQSKTEYPEYLYKYTESLVLHDFRLIKVYKDHAIYQNEKETYTQKVSEGTLPHYGKNVYQAFEKRIKLLNASLKKQSSNFRLIPDPQTVDERSINDHAKAIWKSIATVLADIDSKHEFDPIDIIAYELEQIEATLTTSSTKVLKQVQEERERQNKKWSVQNHNLFVWLAILGEEYGELQHEVVDIFGGEGGTLSNARTELIQVAAVATQIVEYIDRHNTIEVIKSIKSA